MELDRPSLSQVITGMHGELVTVEDDVLEVARRLKDIHPDLSVRWNQQGEYFTIYEDCPDGVERLVTNVKHLDGRLISYFERMAHESWDAVKEIEKMEAATDRERDHAMKERIGEIGERLHHALRKDFHFNQDRIWLPERLKLKVGIKTKAKV